MNNIEALTLKQICSYVAIVNRMEQEDIIKVDIDKSYVEFDYDETLKYLEKQNVRLNNIINELEESLKYWLKLSKENKNMSDYTIYSNVLDILKELKEGEIND